MLEFCVIQLGARLHYAVPAALQQAGMLRVMYTDAHAGSPAARLLGLLAGSSRGAQGIRRLLARTIPSAIPAAKVHTSMLAALQLEWLGRRDPHTLRRARFLFEQGLGGNLLARRAVKAGFGGANALYVQPYVSSEATREAKRRGLFVVMEVLAHPLLKVLEREEYERYGAEPPPDTLPSIQQDNLDFFREEVQHADLVLAASSHVRDGLVDLGLDPARIAIVPYGLHDSTIAGTPKPHPSRVLYVGNIGYMKGVPYLAEAARMLKARGFSGEVRAVGPYDPQMVKRPEFEGLTYVGQVPRSEVGREYLQADVFVFPTLSDGFGIVLLEALAAGLPVICTPNCGNVVKDGVNGFVVPPRDPKALADRIERLTQDRTLRARMGGQASATREDFSMEAYGRRLTAAIRQAYEARG